MRVFGTKIEEGRQTACFCLKGSDRSKKICLLIIYPDRDIMTAMRSKVLLIALISVLAQAGNCLPQSIPPVPIPHDRPIAITLEGRRVLSISGDSFVYNLGHETIVITAATAEFRRFLANVREGRRYAVIRATLIPERRSTFNERFQAQLLNPHQGL